MTGDSINVNNSQLAALVLVLYLDPPVKNKGGGYGYKLRLHICEPPLHV